MNLLQALRGGERSTWGGGLSMDDYAELVGLQSFYFGGLGYQPWPQQTLVDNGQSAEGPTGSFQGLVSAAYAASGPVFAVMLTRQLAFTGVRFTWQRLNSGRPSKMFGTEALGLLERPWPGGTTQDLLTRCINDADLAGNAYFVVDTPISRLGGDGGKELVRLRPDWVWAALVPRAIDGARVGWRRVGYLYQEGGPGSDDDPAAFTAAEVAHWMPVVDPLANWRGMSWLTPVLREVAADKQLTRFRDAFMREGATPSMVVTYPEGIHPDRIKKVADLLRDKHGGAANAFKAMHFGLGADVEVVGRDMQQIAARDLAGISETRIASAGRVSPVIVGMSEGLQGSSLNAGNYGQARRQLADLTMHPLWQSAAGCFAPLIERPRGAGGETRLWYDPRESPFLREDEKNQAEIAALEASTIRQLIDAGYTAESVQAAVEASDWGLLSHSGLFSVQLQPAGSMAGGTPAQQEGQPA